MTTPLPIRRVRDVLLGRAWSRAGAVAAALAQSRARPAFGAGFRVALLVTGSLTLGAAVALMLWNDFGAGPLDVFIGAIRGVTGLPLTFAVWGVVGTLMLLAWLLGGRPGPGTVASPVIVGPVMQLVLTQLERMNHPGGWAAQILVQVVAIAFVGVGAGLLIASGLGAGTGELLATATSNRVGQQEPAVRLGFEVTWLAAGVALGGPVGVGTVLVAAGIGPAVSIGARAVDHVLTRSRRAIAVAIA